MNGAQYQAPADTQLFLPLFKREPRLAAGIGRVFSVALDQGCGAVAFARPQVLALIDENLKDRGIDLNMVLRQRRYVRVDAVAFLRELMLGDKPDSQRFEDHMEGILRPCYTSFRKVAVFSELAALLEEEGQPQSAVRLERLWDRYLSNHPALVSWGDAAGVPTDPTYLDAFQAACSHLCRMLSAEGAVGREARGAHTPAGSRFEGRPVREPVVRGELRT